MWNYEKKKSIQTTISEEFLVGGNQSRCSNDAIIKILSKIFSPNI